MNDADFDSLEPEFELQDALPQPRAVDVVQPTGKPLPVVFDSPHSGSDYPADFGHTATHERIRRMEDAFVDELFAAVPAHGATLVRALFPRAYIDPNRRPDDIDVDILDGPWPGEVNPGPKVKLGIGLIAKRDMVGALYDRQLGVAELEARLERYYWPYHRSLSSVLDAAHGRFDAFWHINCHSMKSLGARPTRSGVRKQRADFCIGDRDGSSCGPAFTELVVESLRELGYAVAVNDPYKGVELVARYSSPKRQRHSLQIEINRALYMNEMTVRKHEGFAALARDLGDLARKVCAFAAARIG